MFDVFGYEKDPVGNYWVITKNGDMWLRVSTQNEAVSIVQKLWEDQKEGDSDEQIQ